MVFKNENKKNKKTEQTKPAKKVAILHVFEYMLYLKGILLSEFYTVTVAFFIKVSAYILGYDLSKLRFAHLSYTSF